MVEDVLVSLSDIARPVAPGGAQRSTVNIVELLLKDPVLLAVLYNECAVRRHPTIVGYSACFNGRILKGLQVWLDRTILVSTKVNYQ